ncbi:MAG: UDP-N-acetylmuramate dehydrogenase [Lachnospiraceae bacterium]|jgi:UDP-N-acetylmuramate dehydrogenase|nr:UDP-N-acetylmuramate dehydrogenase [Lachnospiraceae bacterium]
MNNSIHNRLSEFLSDSQILINEPMKNHTTFKVGGPADFLVNPNSEDELIGVLSLCKEASVPFYIIGNGSDLLVSDKGFRGVIIRFLENYSEINVFEEKIKAQSGALLKNVSLKALEAGLTGLEFAFGIPGTIGGACVMNAGAYDSELKNVIESVRVLTKEHEIRVFSCEEMEFGYRTSRISKENDIVLEAVFSLKKGDTAQIKAKMDDFQSRRKSKQPLEYPSAGSTFKRPEGYFAGKLIQEAGLSGFRIGGACVSEKHCGFVINAGNATAKDVYDVIKGVQERVFRNSGVNLSPEIKFLGEF